MLGKIAAYNNQKDPFIHLDLDYVIYSPFAKEYLNSEVFSENPEAGNYFNFTYLDKLVNLSNNLTVMPENMMKNLNLTGGLVFSQRVLLELPLQGVSREDAYRIVQRNAMKVWEEIQQGKSTTNETGETLYLQYLLADDELRNSLSEEKIRECFNFEYYTKNVDKIFNRVFNK